MNDALEVLQWHEQQIVPAHEVIIHRFAELAHEEIAHMALKARLETDRGFMRVRRSLGALKGWQTRRNHE